MVVGEASIHNIMGGMESTGGVRLHNHKRKLKQRFDIIKKLGQGTYGKVQLGINKETGQEVAIKTIKKCKIETEADLIRIRREIQIMSSVQHPNIIHIYEVFENREKMVLVMEYAAGGELYDYLSERKVLPEEEARRIFRQISIAVFYCHKHKICHRDLKLENILLDQLGNAKIADFGLSNVFDDQRLLHTFCGSPLYASPEIVKGTSYHGPEVDCWSLGVLLYTLVYGAMPFDGSNFKRLARQISASDYFEPKNPSPASPLIKDMLTKCPSRRADIERICSHWWVNESYEQNCLDIAEELAAQTPVRLDLLLSLVPQSASADKLVVTNDQQQSDTNTNISAENLMPTRCHSVGSLMELGRNNEDRLRDIVDEDEEQKSPIGATSDTKRKLETTPSMEETVAAGVKRKERSRKKEKGDEREQKAYRSSSRHHSAPISNAITEEAMEVDRELDLRDPTAAAACLELIREAQSKSPSKERSRTPVVPDQRNIDSTKHEKTTIQNVNENTNDMKPIVNKLDDVSIGTLSVDETNIHTNEEYQSKKKMPKSKTKDAAQKNGIPKSDVPVEEVQSTPDKSEMDKEKSAVTPSPEETGMKSGMKKNKPRTMSLDSDECAAVPPAKPTERRRSKIFETAEKFNQLAAGTETEKPKKIFIPGVNVGGAKRVFERKASLSSVNASPPPKPNASKVIIDVPSEKKNEKPDEKLPSPPKVEPMKSENERKRDEEKKRAVDIITGALGKPPVQKKMNGSPPIIPQSQEAKKGLGLKIQIAPNDVRNATICVSTPVDTKYPDYEASPAKPIAVGNSVPPSPESKSVKNSFSDEPTMSSKMEITLKSATLPRPRKTSKAEIILASNIKSPETAAFKSEVEAKIDAFHPQKLRTQKSEVAFPVAAVIHSTTRSSSLEPESKTRTSAKERIIPIQVEPGHQSPPQQSSTSSLPSKPPMPQRSMSQRSGSLSRQSTMDSDTDSALGSTIGPEPIRKSPREYIIPIAVEGGSYVTPRSDSVEPENKTGTSTNNANPSKTRFGRPRRMGSLLSDASEDESPFSTLHRDSDDLLQRHMHRLRSSRPTRHTPEHADSLSSGEDDDDDGFELLTAENLFSTLLSRVRSLTQRLNVDDNRGTGFPRSRLLDRLGNNSSQGFWGMHEPMSRRMPESPFRRSLSRDTDRFGRKDSAMSSTPGTPNSLGGRSTTPSRDNIFEMGSSNTLPRDKNHRDDTTTADMDPSRLRRESSVDEQFVDQSRSNTKSHENFTPSLARRLSRQFIEQTRHSLPRSPSIPRDRLYRSSTEEPSSSSTTTLLPEKTEYRSRSSDRNLRRTNSLLDAERPERCDFRSTRRSVSLFADDDEELLSPLPRQVMTLGRKYREPVETTVNGIRRDNVCRTEKIQEESHDDLNSPRKSHDAIDRSLETASTSGGTSACNSNPNLGDTMSNISTKSYETSSTESTSNTQGEALNSFKADAKEFESRLLAAENMIKESKLRNLRLNRLDQNLSTSYKDTEKCDKEFLGSMTDLSNSVLGKRRSCIPSLRLRSGSLNREASGSRDRRPSVTSNVDTKDLRAPTPERSLLSKLFRSGSSSRDSEGRDKSPKSRRRISRFLRPDFFDTPREESQYVKEKEAQKAAENERRKARFMKKKTDNNEGSIETNNSSEDRQEKELKNEANALTRDKNELPKDNKSENDISSTVTANIGVELERQNSKNSFLQSLEKKLGKLRSNDAENSKINDENEDGNVTIPNNQENLPVSTVPEVDISEKRETTKGTPKDDGSSSLNEVQMTTSKSRVSSVLGLFRNDSKSTMNGSRNQSNLLSKFKKSAYKGSRSDTNVITGEPSAGSRIPTKSTKSESKSPRRSLENRKSPENMSELKKTPPKDKPKEKTPVEQRLSVERKTSIDRQIKSPKKLSPEKSIERTKSDRVEKVNVKDKSIENEIRKSASPEKNDNKISFTARLMKKSSPDKVMDNRKIEAKHNDSEEKKAVKVKKTVKSLNSVTKNGSVSKLEKDDDSDKKIKKVVKTEPADTEANDGTKKKRIVRVVRKVVKKTDSSSDSKPDEKEKSSTKTMLKKITSSIKKESSPENTEKKKEKNSEGVNKKEEKSVTNNETKDEKSSDLKITESREPTVTKIDPLLTVDAKISIKEPDNKLRTNRSNLKLDLSKIPQHSFKTSVATKKEPAKVNSMDPVAIEIPKKSNEISSRMTHHANITGNKIIIDKPLCAADLAKIKQHESDIQSKINQLTDPEVPKKETNLVSNVKPILEIPSNPKLLTTELTTSEKSNPLSEIPHADIQMCKIPQQKITPDYNEDILSPMDDGESFDSWSICSNDLNHRSSMDLHSPTSPAYSPSARSDHHESIIDRIRRKSFYSRFNEKKRKNSLNIPPSNVTSPTGPTLSRKYSFHSSRDTERRKRNYSTSPTRRSSDRLYGTYNDDMLHYRKSSIERDRYSDIGSSRGSFTGELKSPSDHYGSTSTYYDPLSRYRISPVPDSAHRKYSSRDFNHDSDVGPYKSPLSPSALNDNVHEYRNALSRRYGSVASGLAPKTAEYYEELLAPSRIDYLSPRRTPIPGEYPGKHENEYYNGHIELSRSGSDKWRGFSDKISGLDSAEDSDRSRGDDIRNNSQTDGETKKLSATCPDTDINNSIVE